MIKHIVQLILAFEAKLVIRRFRPKIIAITGSVGKTSTKEAVYAVLSSHFKVRKSPKSYNSGWGVPLTILGLESQWHSIWGWTSNIVKGALTVFAREYPEILVLEMGVDRPGDLDSILKIAKPYISVVTAIGDIPVHVEFFSGPKAVAYEKGKIVRATSSEGFTILNFDDEVVHDMKAEAHGKLMTFGFGKGADIRVSQYKLHSVSAGSNSIPKGVSCIVEVDRHSASLEIEGAFGKQQLYVAAAAVAVGLAFNLPLPKIVEALSVYKPASGRLRLLPGIKNTWILDDTYNASPMAMHAALDTLKDITAKRKIAVLGDMLEIGKFTIQAHQAMGELAKPIVDILMTVGPRAKFIAKEARECGKAPENVMEFAESREAGRKLQEMLQPGDMVLVKGSQSMRMERVVEEVMAEPDKKAELLVRQDEYWQNIP